MTDREETLKAIKAAVANGDVAEARRLAARLRRTAPEWYQSWLWSAWLTETPEEGLRWARQALRLERNATTEQAVEWASERVTAPDAFVAPTPLGMAHHAARRPPMWLLAGAGMGAAVALGILLSVLLLNPATSNPLTLPPQAAANLTATVTRSVLATTSVSATFPAGVAAPAVTALATPERGSAAPTPSLPTPIRVRDDLTERRPQLPAPQVATPVPTVANGPINSPYALWPARDYPAIYRVQAGDTLQAIAAQMGLEPSTLIWANDGTGRQAGLLTTAQELVIPPLNGVLHTVQPGDTVIGLAAKYGVAPAIVVGFSGNHLGSEQAALLPGQRLMVPGGHKPVEAAPAAPSAPAAPTQPSRTARTYTSYFGWPTTGRITTNFSWYHGGIDIAAPLKTPIYASQSGEIAFIGWDHTGYGYMMLIDHHNGWWTRYAHLSGWYPGKGEWVERGELIALMGSTGNSTGSHLHFEILYRGYRYNPFNYLPK